MAADTVETGTEQGAEQSAAPPDDEYEYYKPRPNLQVWLILGGIAFVVAVAVLFIYQAGDDKTILTMEPLGQVAFNAPVAPTGNGQAGGCANGACDLHTGMHHLQQGGQHAGGMHMGGGSMHPFGPGSGHHQQGGMNCPLGGQGTGVAGSSPTAIPVALAGAPAIPTLPPAGKAAGAGTPSPKAPPAVCARCGGEALAICSHCGSVMLPMGESLFYCSQCGTVGSPPCPYCGARMTPAEQREPPERLAVQAAPRREDAVGGQFVCPNCQATGLPNWDATGRAICPSCGATMTAQTAQRAQ